MSIEAMSWALNDAPVSDASALLVLVGLANHAGRDGAGAYPSRETLAHYARCSVRTVSIKLRALEESGVIKRGDQELVAHFRADRRPVVYDLDYGVKILHPVGSGYDAEKRPAPRNDVQEPNGVKPDVERGEAHGIHDVQTPAHKPSLEPSITSVVVNSPIDELAKRKGWWPSDAALATARNLEPITDIPLSVTRYVVIKHERKQKPESAEWLKWFIEDEKKARAEERQDTASRFRARKWYDVAE